MAWPDASTPKQALNRVSLAGQLKLEPHGRSLVGCPQDSDCCTQESQEAILVGEDGATIRVPHFGCFGDESRRCCNVDARGQMVVATGSLELRESGAGQRWVFWDEVTLCAL
jgi:hypothetical protein